MVLLLILENRRESFLGKAFIAGKEHRVDIVILRHGRRVGFEAPLEVDHVVGSFTQILEDAGANSTAQP